MVHKFSEGDVVYHIFLGKTMVLERFGDPYKPDVYHYTIRLKNGMKIEDVKEFELLERMETKETNKINWNERNEDVNNNWFDNIDDLKKFVQDHHTEMVILQCDLDELVISWIFV